MTPNLVNEKELLNLRNVMMTSWAQLSFEIYAKNIYHFLRHFGNAFYSSATGVTVKIKGQTHIMSLLGSSCPPKYLWLSEQIRVRQILLNTVISSKPREAEIFRAL